MVFYCLSPAKAVGCSFGLVHHTWLRWRWQKGGPLPTWSPGNFGDCRLQKMTCFRAGLFGSNQIMSKWLQLSFYWWMFFFKSFACEGVLTGNGAGWPCARSLGWIILRDSYFLGSMLATTFFCCPLPWFFFGGTLLSCCCCCCCCCCCRCYFQAQVKSLSQQRFTSVHFRRPISFRTLGPRALAGWGCWRWRLLHRFAKLCVQKSLWKWWRSRLF